jgi:type 1 glutamine amidotransferase
MEHSLRPGFCTASIVLLVLSGCLGSRPAAPDDSTQPWETLFDGTGLEGWQMVGPGGFELEPDGSMLARGGMGLLYYAGQTYRDFELELDWKVASDTSNSGVFVRFPAPSSPWDAVNEGYEIQINDRADPLHRTGSIYSFAPSFRPASNPAGEWNRYRVTVVGQRYQVYLNGHRVADFVGDRSREGFVGLQNHDYVSRAWFRNIRIRPLDERGTAPPEILADLFAVPADTKPIRVLMLTATHGFRHEPAIEAAKETMRQLAATTEFEVVATEDLTYLSRDSLSGYDLVFLANTTLRGGDPMEVGEVEGTSLNVNAARTYALSLDTGQGIMNAVAALLGDPGSPAGRIHFEGFPEKELRDVRVDGNVMTFNFDGEQYGHIEGEAVLEGDAWNGTIVVEGAPMPLVGERVADDYQLLAADVDPKTLPRVSAEQRQALIDFLKAGKGVVAAHAAVDAFQPWNPLRGRREPYFRWDEYRAMLGGGLFSSHPWTQGVRVQVERKDHPAVAHLGEGFWIRDEIYVLDESPRAESVVLASLDTSSVDLPAQLLEDGKTDVPIAWVRQHNGGTVFVTTLGHFPDVWTTPDFIQLLLQGMRVAAGRLSYEDLGGGTE